MVVGAILAIGEIDVEAPAIGFQEQLAAAVAEKPRRPFCALPAIARGVACGLQKGRDKRPSYDALLKAFARREIDLEAGWSVDRLGV